MIALRSKFSAFNFLGKLGLGVAVLWLCCLSSDLGAQQSRTGGRVSGRTTAKMAAKNAAKSIAKSTADTSPKPFEDQFWKYLIGNNYKNWSPGPGTSGDFYTGQNPHGALLKMYLNRTAAGRSDNFPMGSVIILENYRADKSLKTISVMYRTDGFDPNANDWYWIEYHPDGTVVKAPVDTASQIKNVSLGNDGLEKDGSRDGRSNVARLNVAQHGGGFLKPTMGRAANCIACHRNGNGNDFVFFNDRNFDIAKQPNEDRVAVKRSRRQSH